MIHPSNDNAGPAVTSITLHLCEADVARIADAVARRLAPPVSAPSRLTIEQTAERLHRHPRSVRRLIASGRLRASKLAEGGSSRMLVDAESVDALLAAGAR